MISFDVVGDKKLVAYLGDVPKKTIEKVDASVNMLTLRLQRRALGKVSEKTGKLRGALVKGTYFIKTEKGITGRVGLRGAPAKIAIYGAVQEYGGSIKAHVLQTKDAAALRFKIGGKFMFAKTVNIPAFKVPAHSFLRSSLNDMQGEIVSELNRAAGIQS